MNPSYNPPIRIAHELENRIRLRSQLLRKPDINPDYLEAVIESIGGVESVRINSRAGSVVVHYDGHMVTREAIITTLANLPAEVTNGDGKPKTLCSILSLIGRGVFVLSLVFLPPFFRAAAAFVFSIPVLAQAIITLWIRGIKVQVLDGAAVAFCLLRRDYFAAASIVYLLSVGEFLEELSEDRTTGLLKSLLKPQVEKIWIELEGQEIEIGIDQARIGDHVICGPGELVPLDGVIIRGEALVNTSSITGEAVPVHVEPGDEIMSGAVVEEGRLVFEAREVGSNTSMAKISTFLENSLRNESPSQKESEALADKLVPVTFGLGLGLYIVTHDLEKAAAVLTVDYSCAIKLANPVAVRVAMFTAARQDVLLKGAQAMDGLSKIDTMIFDKTGTLTKGELQVTDILGLAPFANDELLILAASAEEHYAHPVAAAVVQAAKDKGLDLSPTSQVDFIVAHGVSAYINGKNILVGSRHFIEEDEGIACSGMDSEIADLLRDGKSLLYVACEEKFAGVIGMRDELRPEAAMVLDRLKQSGIEKIVILTGDAELTARALAAQLPAVDEVHWELKPVDKAGIVKEMQKNRHRVGFIGDGVNDAPALVSADVGICLPDGADLAKESAQVILLKNDLRTLLAGRLIALRSRETINHSFGAAVGLNSVFLLLASFGIVQPVTAALLHNTTTVGILSYAAVRGRKIPEKEMLPGVSGNQEER